MSGWIKLHRSLENSFLWKENRVFSKAEAWIDILITVNYENKKTLISQSVIECKRGQSLLSLESWAKRWGWCKSKVRRFFILLQNENMIVTESVQKTTRLTVCNYEKYQDLRNDTETELKHKRNGTETELAPTKESKELKNKRNKDNNNNIPEQVGCDNSKVISIGDSEKELYNQALKAFYEYYHNQYGTKYNFTAKDGNHLKQLLKKIEAKCREGDKLTDNENILNAFNYFISGITDRWILTNFTLPIINSKFNEIVINLKNGNDPKLKTRRTINGITGYYSDEDVEILKFYYQSAG